MARRPCNIRQSEVSRAVKGVQQAGITIERVEIEPNGKIVVLVHSSTADKDKAINEWDNVK